MSFRVVDEIIFPSSIKIAAFAETFSTIEVTTPSELVILSISPSSQAFSHNVLLFLVNLNGALF